MVKNPHSLQGFIYISGSSGSLGFLNHLPERMTECLGLAGFFSERYSFFDNNPRSVVI